MSVIEIDEAALVDVVDDKLGTSVGKALALLEAFESIDVSLGVSELARRAGIPKSTAFRLLAILEERRVIERQGTRYTLGKRMFEIGNRVSFCRPHSLRDTALPHLNDLYELTHETVHLAVLDGTDVLYVEKLFGHHQVRVQSAVGGRVPAYCSAIGKAMLAASDAETTSAVLARGLSARTGYTIVARSMFELDLSAARTNGIAFDHEEFSIGVNCVAAPIVSRTGRLVGGVSVCGPTGRFSPTGCASSVAQVARAIGRSVTR